MPQVAEAAGLADGIANGITLNSDNLGAAQDAVVPQPNGTGQPSIKPPEHVSCSSPSCAGLFLG